MRKILLFLFLSSLFYCTSIYGQADSRLQQEEHLLDGKSFIYQYQSGSAIDISFTAGTLTYQWIAGRNAGNPAKTYPYKSRKLRNGIYYVNWHEPVLKNFITLVYNFNNNTCASSVIVNYGSEKSFTTFEGGVIEKVSQK